jgi:hypothetical protein
MKALIALLIATQLLACASAPQPNAGGEYCVETQMREGKERCVQWHFGPTREQQKRFAARNP